MYQIYFHLKTLLLSSKAALKFKALLLVIFPVFFPVPLLLRLVGLSLEGFINLKAPPQVLLGRVGGLLTSNCSTYSLSLPSSHFLVKGG